MDLTALLFDGLPVETVLAFALTSAIIELTPGPNMTWLAVVAATEGRRSGYAAVLGVSLGLAVIGLAACFGLAALITDRPMVFQVLRWVGVGYLLWLAYDAWRDADADSGGPVGVRAARYFRRGLITNLLNPKAAVFYVAVLPGFLPVGGDQIAESVALTLIYVAVATAIHGGIVTLAGTARLLLEDPVRERMIRRMLAVALVLVALWFAWGTQFPAL